MEPIAKWMSGFFSFFQKQAAAKVWTVFPKTHIISQASTKFETRFKKIEANCIRLADKDEGPFKGVQIHIPSNCLKSPVVAPIPTQSQPEPDLPAPILLSQSKMMLSGRTIVIPQFHDLPWNWKGSE